MFEINNSIFETIVVPDAFAETIISNLREAIVAVVLNNTVNARMTSRKGLENLMELAKVFCTADELYFKMKGVTNTTKFYFSKKNKADEMIQLFTTITRTNVWYENPINELGKIGFSWHDCRTDKAYELYYLVKTEEEQ